MYKTYFEKNKKLVRKTTISIAILITATLIFSGAISAIGIQGNSTKMNKIVTDPEIDAQISCGPAPKNLITPYPSDLKSSSAQQAPISEDCYTMYAAKSWTSNDELVWFDTCDPGTVEAFGDYIAGSPTSGGTYGCDGVWYLAEQSSGVLYGADIYTGDMWSIGGGGMQCNGLAYDPITNRMYGIHGVASPGQDVFYEVDPLTGEQTVIGTIGGSIYYTIGMAFDADGTLWGWDVATDSLFTIDTGTGEATVVASLSIDLNYGQDGDFHRESNVLYLTAVTSSIQVALFTVDLETGECTLIDSFPNQEQITSSCFENTCEPPEHDVGVKAILKPEASGHAVPEMEMELLVKNYGNNTETFDAQMEIIKCESSGDYLLEEHFDGDTFPPENWTTDWWTSSNSNYASGEPPEARVYRYDQYYGGQSYDNYIQTGPVNCSGWDLITMTFRWGSDLNSPQYCNFFVKYRKNDTSPWKDVSPWDNPLGEESEGDLYTIDCYGFGGDLGEAFQVRFEYIGYWSYYNYFWLDDVTIEGCGGCAEYAEIVEGITLDAGEEMIVEFPGWEPTEWQNESYEDTWEEYPVHGFTMMDGDQNPRNNNKWILLELYYPWLYDIEITEIGSPQESRSMPARTFDVEATITNVGQYELCCIPIDISIGAPVVLDTVLEETEWPTTGAPNYYIYYPGYGNGWRDEHKAIAYYYGWQYNTGSQAGGDPPQAYIPYYRCQADRVFYSAAFDTTEYATLNLNFLTYINHFSGSGLYTLEAGYSHDGENWYAAWSEAPSSSGGYEVSVPIEGGSETTYIGFWCKGNPYYFNYWYLDNVEVVAVGLIEEYTDTMCQGDDLMPGESRVFNFDDWTPDFLAEETTAWGVPYIAQATIEVEGDKDPGNDMKVNDFELDYWHDPALEKVTSPIGGGRGDLLWDNGDTDGSNGYSILGSPKRTLLDDFELEESVEISELRCYMVAGPVSDWEVAFWTDDDGDPGESFEVSKDVSFTTEYTGRTWFGYSEWEVFYEFEPILLDPGRYWVEIWSGTGAPNAFLMIHADVWGSECWVNYDDLGFKPGSEQFGVEADLNYRLYGEVATGPPPIMAYIQPGTESIDAVAINYGTFSELDLTCSAEIWEYITEPENGTLQYEDEVTNIDLDTPLGGTVNLAFKDFTFADEGRYGLYLDMPDNNADDDFPKNNKMRWGVGVDDTKPTSDYTLTPPDPTGLEDWYVSDVEVTLDAMDPLSNDVSSGVKEIKYKIGTGSWQTITGPTGTFVIHDDGDDIPIEYYAIDKVGNEESPNVFTIDMDQTPPEVGLAWEAEKIGDWWYVNFTATATDVTAKMWKVEFFLNDVLQGTVTGLGPTYNWLTPYAHGATITYKSTAFDIAGNNVYATVDNDDITPVNFPSQKSASSSHVMCMRTLLQR